MYLKNKLFALFFAAVIVCACFYYPLNGLVLFLCLSIYGAVLWFFPAVWLFAVPAFLPLLDFSPVTGLLFFNEFDLVVLTTILIFNLKKRESGDLLPYPKGAKFCIALLTCSYVISTLIGIFPLQALDMNSFTSYYSEYISLRAVKGYIEALMFIPMIRQDLCKTTSVSENSRRDAGSATNIKKYLIPGLLTGFAGVLFFALWERQLFPGLFNFSNDYRITSTFFEMNTGGAFIDGYLSMLLPFVFTCFLVQKSRTAKIIGSGLFVAGLYAMLVTFSRICYASFLISMVILMAGVTTFSHTKWKAVMLGTVAVLIAALVIIPVLKGGYIIDRFSKLSQGINTRTHLWERAIQKMNDSDYTYFFGMGPGTYPETYLKNPDGIKPGYYKFVGQGRKTFLRLFPGDSMYFGQRISLTPHIKYTLTFDARAKNNKAALTFPICEKSVLYSFHCNWKTIDIVNKKNHWAGYRIIYPGFKIGQGKIYQKRPVEFALYNGNRNTVIDVDNIKLTNINGKNIIKNGAFTHGSNFWFFSTDNHLAWHIENIWISRFFETGITGLMASGLFVSFVLMLLIQDIFKRDIFSLILFSSFCGFLIVGFVGSLFDSPRLLFLFYFVSFISIFYSSIDDNNNRKIIPWIS